MSRVMTPGKQGKQKRLIPWNLTGFLDLALFLFAPLWQGGRAHSRVRSGSSSGGI